MYRLAMFAAMATCIGMPYNASADLILDSSLGGVAGNGLGNVFTILTIAESRQRKHRIRECWTFGWH